MNVIYGIRQKRKMSDEKKTLLKNIGAAIVLFFIALGCAYVFASALDSVLAARGL